MIPSRNLHTFSTSSLAGVPSILSDPAMSILVRRRPDEGLTELWIRSPGSTLRNAFTLQVYFC
uniref:Uncharacterized protein n=1 Tax=Mesocestoides corti TaxID=53468 RepID=A0A5K3G2F3_MESCO